MPTAKVPFIGGAYKSRTPNANAQESTNLFFHHDKDKERDSLKHTPGLEVFTDFTNEDPPS
jgi:hypothetical protein